MIEFSNPSALWLLTLAIPLVLLYLLKRRRRDLEVPSLMLWKQALEDLRAHRPFQKLRSQLLLYLQILILVLITAILAEPHIIGKSRQSRRWVLVMDVSASMQATDVKPNRFEAARDQLFLLMDQATPSDELLLLSLGAEASVLQPFTGQQDVVRRKLLALQPEDTAGNWQQLALILEPLARESPPPRIVVASDFAGLPAKLLERIPFDAVPTGNSGDNIAIVRVVAEPLPENPETQELFYQIRNYAPARRALDVELLVDDRAVDAFNSELAPAGALDRTTLFEVKAPVTIKVRVKPDDALTLDNEFVLPVVPATRIRVSNGYGNPFLLKALEALPSVELSKQAAVRIDASTLETSTSPGIYFITPGTGRSAARVVQWNTTHPALQFIDAGLWAFTRVSALHPPADADILMETAEGPVAYARETNAGRILILGFQLEDSNLYQLAGFPVFLQNAIHWIAEGSIRRPPTLTGAANPREGPLQTSEGGGYVNFADAEESRIQPGKPPGLSQSGTRQIPRKHDLARWFLILALGIVILEWWAFHQRVEFS